MIIVGIDTSCDETSVGVVRDGQIVANIISSQVALHKAWGGVVPSLAKVAHRQRLPVAWRRALLQAKIEASAIDLIAVTQGPGLAMALETGIDFAQARGQELSKPVIGINHLHGHLMTACLDAELKLKLPELPALVALVSGGHTEILAVTADPDQPQEWQVTKLGQTLDDACGEAFDKAAIMLELGYPGGALVARLADLGQLNRFSLPVPMLKNPTLDLSYSGLKTAMLYLIKKIESESGPLTADQVRDLAATFQDRALSVLINKLELALQRQPNYYRSLWLVGGVAANRQLRARFRQLAKRFQLSAHYPPQRRLTGDNGAMIAMAAWQLAGPSIGRGKTITPPSPAELDRLPNLSSQQITIPALAAAARQNRAQKPADRSDGVDRSPIDRNR